jgi:hypothetical protein
VLLERGLVAQQAIERPVEPVILDARGGQGKHILERRVTIPILRNVQLARGLAQARQHQHGRHRRPRHGLAPGGDQPLQDLIEPQGPPQRPAEPHVAERAASLEPNPVQVNGDRLVGLPIVEQIGLHAVGGDGPRQSRGTGAALGIELAQLGDGLLDNLAADAHGTDQTPVPVDLAVLPARRVAQVHCSAYRACATAKSTNLVGTTSRFQNASVDPDRRCERRDPGSRRSTTRTAEVGLARGPDGKPVLSDTLAGLVGFVVLVIVAVVVVWVLNAARRRAPNPALERPAGSPSLAAAAHRER